MRVEYRPKVEDFARKLTRKHKECTVIFNMEDEPITINDFDGENNSGYITENGTAHASIGARNISRKNPFHLFACVDSVTEETQALDEVSKHNIVPLYHCTIFAKSE